MAIYTNALENSGLLTIEQIAQPHGNLAFLTLAHESDVEKYSAFLKNAGYAIRATSRLNGQWVIVSEGNGSPDTVLQALAQHGEKLHPYHEPTPTDWWAVRGALGIAGQSLQLSSAFTQVEQKNGSWARKPFSVDIAVFAVLNLIANFSNFIYGGQKEPDINRTRYIGRQLHDTFSPNTPFQEPVADPSTEKKQGIFSEANEFLKRHSVRFFELGLRFFAAIALVMPLKKSSLVKGWGLLKQGEVVAAAKAVKNPNFGTFYAGWAFIVGKVVAWFSKVPDPYDPAPHSWLDTVREKYLFHIGSVIEATAGVGLAQNALAQKRIGFAGTANPPRDWLGAVGGGMFTAAYILRLGANFGSKKIDVSDVTRYTAGLLANTPPQQLPQLAADAAATLTSHFADKKVSFGAMYGEIMKEMQKARPYSTSSHLENQAVGESTTAFTDRLAAAREAKTTQLDRAA